MDRTVSTGQEAQSGANGPEVERLIAAGKCKQAVELAKAAHKRLNSPASEKLLFDAYLARIEQFQNKGAAQDAQTLLDLVRQRFPAHQGRLKNLALKSAAVQGNVDALVLPLANGDVPAEQRSVIESALRRSLTDLPRLANCATLPLGHPLRTAAAALCTAFDAVTAGPVSDQQIALAEVSRQSPLADWKLLVRGLAAFYREQNDACRRNLNAIAQDSAVRRLANVLISAMDQTPPLPGRSDTLQARIIGGDKTLREALLQLEADFSSYDLTALEHGMRAALEACAASHPELLDTLRQRISIRCAMTDVPVKNVLRVMGPTRKNSGFWRLLARSAEMQQTPQPAAALWDRFRVHAIAEEMFAPGSMEDAAVLLHAAGLLGNPYSAPMSNGARLFRYVLDYYHNQPEEITALRPKSPAEVAAAIDADHLFRRAVEIDPHPLAFLQWHAWALAHRLPDRKLQELAELWHRKLPSEPRPLLLLSQLAEDRNALKLAMKYLSQAEALDPMNPAVRKARMRLTLSTTWKHFNDRKPHLVEQDLQSLGSLPAMTEGDRPALLEAMRAASHAIVGDIAAAQQAAGRIVDRAGPLMAPYLLESVKQWISLPHHMPPKLTPPALLEPVMVAEAESRVVRLTQDTGLTMFRPQAWAPMVGEALALDPCPLSQTTLLNIAMGAIDMDEFEQAYRASAAGLATATGSNAAWLFLRRAQSLPEWAGRRATQCLRAALELSRQGHDPELAAQITDAIDDVPEAQAALGSSAGRGLGGELLEEVLKNERSARKYPRDRADAEKYVVAMAVPSQYDALEDDFDNGDFDNDDFDDEDGDDGGGPFDDADLPALPANISPDLIEDIFRSLALPLPKKGGRIDAKLISQVAAALGAMLNNKANPAQGPDERGGLPPLFGRGRRKKR